MFVQGGVKPVDIVSFFLIKQAAFLVFFGAHRGSFDRMKRAGSVGFWRHVRDDRI